MRRSCYIVALAALHVSLAFSQVQQHARLFRMYRNLEKLSTTLQLDHQTYMAGETIEISVTIRNPTDEPLEAFKPGPNGFRQERKMTRARQAGAMRERFPIPAPISKNWRMRPTSCCNPGRSSPPRLTLLRPLSFSSGAVPCRNMQAPTGCSFPAPTRSTRLWRQYWSGSPELRCGSHYVFKREAGKSETLADYARVLVLSIKGQHYICLSRETEFRRPLVRANSDHVLNFGEVRELAPYTRFAESDTPILSLTATADVNDTLTITWTTAQSSASSAVQSHVLQLDKAQWLVEKMGPETWKESERIEIR